MICPNCGNDKYNVVKVLRNRRMKDGRFVVNDHVDSRFIVCTLCGERYISEAKITHRIVHKNFRTFSKNIFTNQENLFKWDEDD